MRYIRYFVLAAIAVCLITVALANREVVTLKLMPQGLADLLGYSVEGNSVALPLFVVIFGGLIGGILLGFVWEWLREHKHRAEAVNQRREKEKLAREMAKLKSDTGPNDEVLALLEEAR